MNFVVLYCIRNQYEMIEEFAFKFSPIQFDRVNILIYDDNSNEPQKNKLKKLCERYHNIKWINQNQHKFTTNPVVSSFDSADKYLIENNIKSKWILFFENDVFPFHEMFWDDLNSIIETNNFLDEKVGLFGFSSYQDFKSGIKRSPGNPTIGRGCLLDGILNPPHSGWYKDLSDEWYDTDYFVVEVPNWQSVCLNRKLFRENIDIDLNQPGRLLSVDSLSHQFMFKGFYNLVFPKLSVYHDNILKKKINSLQIDSNYSRNVKKTHNHFKELWGFYWGYRNKNLRSEFQNFLNGDKNCLNLWNDSIQEKIFNMNIKLGPQRIQDFE